MPTNRQVHSSSNDPLHAHHMRMAGAGSMATIMANDMTWDSYDHAEQRAKEAIFHKADRCFLAPSDLLHLIKCYRLIDWERFAAERETLENLGVVEKPSE